jgi:N-methylhydantoinase A
MKLDLEAARRAIQQSVAAKLGISVEQAAWGIYQVVNENMANAARVHVIERGKDPQKFPLFALGGAGPVHGFGIAKALGTPALIAPLGAGVMSSVGFLLAPLSFDFVRSWRIQLSQLSWNRANAVLREMESEGQALLESSGVPAGDVRHRREADMRYVGQGYEIRVPLPEKELSAEDGPALLAAFEQTYQQLYGRLGPPVPVEIINWRVLSTGPKPSVSLAGTNPTADPRPSANPRKGSRPAYFPECGGFVDTPVYDRYAIPAGMAFDGPSIIEERESTAIVGPGSRWRVDEQANLIVEFR